MRRLLTSCLTVGSLLVSAGALRAQDVTTYVSQDYESETVDWKTGTTGRFDPVIKVDSEGNHYLTVDQGSRNNNGTTITGNTFLSGDTCLVKGGIDFTLSFDLKLGNSTNQTPVEFFITDSTKNANNRIFSLVATATWGTTWTLNGGSAVNLPGTAGNNTADISDNGVYVWYTIKLTRKTYGESVATFVTITNKATQEEALSRSIVPTMSAIGGLGPMIMYTKRYNANFAIDNVLVRSVEEGDAPSGAPVEWYVKCVDENGAEIAPAVATVGFEGDVILANAAQSADFITSDGTKKYIYVSGNEEKLLSAENNEIVLVFREAEVWKYTVNAVDASGNVLAVLANDSTFEDTDVSVAFPQNILVDGDVLYATSAINKEYNKYFTLSADDQIETLTYSPSINYVAQYFEAEDIEGLTVNRGATVNVRGSHSAGAYNSSTDSVKVLTLQPGQYKLTFATFRNVNANGTLYFKVGDNTNDSIAVAVEGGNYVLPHTPDTVFTITEPTNVYLLPSTNAGHLLDYLYARYATANVTVKYVDDETNDSIKADATFEAATYAANGQKYAAPENLLADFNGAVLNTEIASIDTTYTYPQTEVVPADTTELFANPDVEKVSIIRTYDDTADSLVVIKTKTLNTIDTTFAYTYANMVYVGGNDSIEVKGDGTDVITLRFVDDRTSYYLVAVDSTGAEIKNWDKQGWKDGKVNEEVVLDEDYTTAFESDGNFYAYKSGNEGTILVKDSTLNVIKLVFENADSEYTVKFINKADSTELKEAVVSYGIPGSSVVATESQLADIEKDGKTFALYAEPDTLVLSDAEGAVNVLALYFGQTTSYSLVKVDQDGNSIADTVVVEPLFVGDAAIADSTEQADITLEGNKYVYESGNDSIVLAENDNEIKFVFNQVTAHYTVNFLDEADNTVLKEAVVTADAVVGETVAPKLSQLSALKVSGIEYISTISDPSEAAITVGTDESKNVINLYFRQNSTTYTIRYVSDVTGEELKSSDVVTGVVPGATVAAAESKLGTIKNDNTGNEEFVYVSGNDSITLDIDASKNVITLVYTQHTTKYIVRYVNADGEQISKANEGAGIVGDTLFAKRTDKAEKAGGYVLDEEASAEVLANGIVLGTDASANELVLVFKIPTDAIVYISADQAKANGPIYSLNGSIVVNPGRGLYIQNGHIIMIK